MIWDLPTAVEIDGKQYQIRNKCDYRVVLDVICALNDNDLEMENRLRCALFIFYENLSGCKNFQEATDKMLQIVNNGEEETEQENKPALMSWEHDFPQITPPISRVLGYDVRTPDKYTHWYTFLGGYMEIGECRFQNIVSIRDKIQKGKKLDDWEREFYKQNKKTVDLPQNLTDEEKEWLNSDW